MATREDGVQRATAIVAALREEYSGEELAAKLSAELAHADRVNRDAGYDEEWQARGEVYFAALQEARKQSA